MKDYDKIYQYDELGANNAITYSGDSTYLANVFKRDTSNKKEVLNEIGINTLTSMEKCTVYINPRSDSKNITDLQKVELKEGDYENLVPGYNTIELKEPIELTGNSFVVVVRSEKTGTKVNIPLISKNENYWSKFEAKEGVSFIATEDDIQSNQWLDTTKIENVTPGNITIKALTSYIEEEPEEVKLVNIEIKTKPNKLEYIKDEEDIDLTGGVLKLTYSDKTTKEILMNNKDVQISGYDKTKEGTQTITVTYQGFKQTFTVKVIEKQVKKETKISDYEKSKANIVQSASYTYTDKNKKNYTVMTIKVSGIKFGDTDSKREFFYYISGEKGKKDITDSSWTKIENMTKEKDGTYTATIKLDSRSMNNVLELSKSENIIVYIREKSTLEESSLEATNEFTAILDTKAEIYVDDKKQENIEDVLDKNNNKDDNTKATGTIPQTGVKLTIITIIAIMLGTTLFIFIKIRRMKDIK